MLKTIVSIASFLMILQFIACSPSAMKHEELSTGIIDSDSPDIQFIGRFDYSDPHEVQFDWPGVYICARFEGTSCSVRLNDHKNEYEITIDHRAPKLLTTDSSSVYQVASGLSDLEPHSIMIQKRTETFIGMGKFAGFILDKGCRLLAPEKRPDRRIEFIGNSITCGFGVEGDSSGCHFSPETENACMSYAAMTSRALNADYSMIAYSGRGMVRNYGDSNKVSVNPMPRLYDRVCFSDSAKKWDFSRWVPQAVVINLGTNDFSTQPWPDSTVFEDAYVRLIQRVRWLYPGVTIFCICGPMIGEPCWGYIKDVVTQEQKGKRDKDVFFIGIEKNILSDSDWGCDMHPNILGMVKMTDIIVSVMRTRMNW